MAENKNICEEIQIAILSDEALTDDQLKHIENCKECKALLSQTETMKNDLGALNIPGIEDGQITDAVIKKIKSEKLSAPIPKFRLTHHLGTAAALAIILSAALMIKNPSVDTAQKAVVDNTEALVEEQAEEQEIHHIHAYGEEDYSDEAFETESTETTPNSEVPVEPDVEEAEEITEEIIREASQDEQTQGSKADESESESRQSEGTPETSAENSDNQNSNIDVPSANETVEDAVWDNYGFDSYENDVYDGYDTDSVVTEETIDDFFPEYIIEYELPDAYTSSTSPMVDSVETPAKPSVKEEPVKEEPKTTTPSIPEPESEPVVEAEPIPESEFEIVLEPDPPTEIEPPIEFEPVPVPESEPEPEEIFEDGFKTPNSVGGGSSGGSSSSSGNIFDGVQFQYGEENFDSNIALANSLICEHYGSEYMLTRELLASMGCTTNAEFISFIYSYTIS